MAKSKEPDDVYFTGAGKAIRRAREERDKTLDDVARIIGFEKSTLQRYELNQIKLPGKVIQAIAKALRIKGTVLMTECLLEMRPKLKGSPFGDMLYTMVGKKPKPKRRKPPKLENHAPLKPR